MIDICRFCGVPIESDGTEEHRYKMLVIHVWAHHDETHLGISLKETLRNGPTYGDDRDSEE